MCNSCEKKIITLNLWLTLSYHQKYLLQRHPALTNALDVEPGEELIKNHVAARINGYVGGFGTMAGFDKEWKAWGITEEMAEYIRDQIRSQS